MKIEVDYPGTCGFLHSDERGESRRVGAVHSSKSGFTLFELIVTIAVSSILVGIAVPSYRNLIISNRLTTATNDFIATVNLAKLESVRRNTAIQVCAAGGTSNNGSDSLGTACTGSVCGNGSSATAGTICTLNSDGSAAKLYGAPNKPTAISIIAPTALRYGGQGLARSMSNTAPTYTGLFIDVWTDKLTTNNHRCVYLTTGSTISSCSFTSSTDGCPTSEPTTCR